MKGVLRPTVRAAPEIEGGTTHGSQVPAQTLCNTHPETDALKALPRTASSPSAEPPRGVMRSVVLQHQPRYGQGSLARLPRGLKRPQVVGRDPVCRRPRRHKRI